MKQAEVAKLTKRVTRQGCCWDKAGSGHLLTLLWQRGHTPQITDM